MPAQSRRLVPDLVLANQRLKQKGARCAIEVKNYKLNLRAILPVREGGSATRQQRILLDTTDILEAETLGYTLRQQLENGTFKWESWQGKDSRFNTCGDFRKIAAEFYERGLDTGRYKDRTSWNSRWMPALNKLPEDDNCFINPELIETVIECMPVKCAARRDQGNMLCMIAEKKFGWDMKEARELAKGYNLKSINPKDIPSDESILDYYNKIKVPHWKWFYAMVATYGLRPHEAAEVEINRECNAEIQDDTKSGYHIAPALHSEWFDRMNCFDIERPEKPKGKEWKKKFTHNANCYFTQPRGRKRGNAPLLPFQLYSLRHAYAVRHFRRGTPSAAGAKFMGHDERIHNQHYKRWATVADTNALIKAIGL